jgi:hypothetical protein
MSNEDQINTITSSIHVDINTNTNTNTNTSEMDEMISMVDDLEGVTPSPSKYIDYKERRRNEIDEHKRNQEAECTFKPSIMPSKIDSLPRKPLYPSEKLDQHLHQHHVMK